MARVIITALIVAAIAGGIFYYNSGKQKNAIKAAQQAIVDAQEKQMADLQSQLAALRKENDDLKSQLAKLQAEQANLAEQNEIMSRAIAQYRATGMMPGFKLPYPPK